MSFQSTWVTARYAHILRVVPAVLMFAFYCQSALAIEWDAHTAITDVTIENPDPEEDDVWLVDTRHTLNCGTSSDTDRWREDENDDWHNATDSVTHYWEATRGSFLTNDFVGVSVEYIAPFEAVNVTITVYADDDYAPTNNTALVDETAKSDSDVVQIVGLEVHEVGFAGGDHQLHRTPADDTEPESWDDGVVAIVDPIWIMGDSANTARNHVCWTKGATPATDKVKCRVPVPLTKSASFKLKASGSTEWSWEDCSISAGNTESSEVSNTCAAAFLDKVNKASYNMAWKFICPTGANVQRSLNSTLHPVYITWSTPYLSYGNATVKRIDYVCGAADGLGGPGPPEAPKTIPQRQTECADAVYDELRKENHNFNLDGPLNGPAPVWLLHGGGTSQCPGLAKFIQAHFDMLGLVGSQIRYCFAKADHTAAFDFTGSAHNETRSFPVTGHSDPTTHDDHETYELLLMTGGGVPNHYEAACFYNWKYYYLVGLADGRKSTPFDVVKDCFTIKWYYWDDNATPDEHLDKWKPCSEVPWPD